MNEFKQVKPLSVGDLEAKVIRDGEYVELSALTVLLDRRQAKRLAPWLHEALGLPDLAQMQRRVEEREKDNAALRLELQRVSVKQVEAAGQRDRLTVGIRKSIAECRACHGEGFIPLSKPREDRPCYDCLPLRRLLETKS